MQRELVGPGNAAFALHFVGKLGVVVGPAGGQGWAEKPSMQSGFEFLRYFVESVEAAWNTGRDESAIGGNMAFKIAGSQVLKKAAQSAQPVILEPIMAVEVTTPEDYMGDVIGDLNSRRGQIQAMEERSGARVVKAQVPLSEMFGYVGDLRSKTQGRANYSMVFDSYAEVPANVSKEIIAKATGQ